MYENKRVYITIIQMYFDFVNCIPEKIAFLYKKCKKYCHKYKNRQRNKVSADFCESVYIKLCKVSMT